MARVFLLMGTGTYRATAFMEAAARLGIPITVGSDTPQALAPADPAGYLRIPFSREEEAVERIEAFARQHPLAAVMATDDDGAILAAKASAALGLPHNSVESVEAARDKYLTRRRLAAAGERTPWFDRVHVNEDPWACGGGRDYPCVLKPLAMSGSRGVIRADDRERFEVAFYWIAAILEWDSRRLRPDDRRDWILVEEYLAGEEMAVEGLIHNGRLKALALFDKPDPLDGPFFEESIYVTPTRRPEREVKSVVAAARRAVSALGLTRGPVHIEVRIDETGPWVVEVAPRSIGGLCSRTLRFGRGMTLEEVILLHAIGRRVPSFVRESAAAGVMMIPIPRGGILRRVTGLRRARAVPGVEDVRITIPLGTQVMPLPAGDRYLGFIFARARRPGGVVAALRQAHSRLAFRIVAANLDVPWVVDRDESRG